MCREKWRERDGFRSAATNRIGQALWGTFKKAGGSATLASDVAGTIEGVRVSRLAMLGS